MDERAIEVNRNFKSIASSWLGIDAADLKSDVTEVTEECISFPKEKLKSSHKEKTDDCVQKVVLERKKKNDHVSAASFVSGKLQCKLKKMKRRERESKYEDMHHSTVMQEKFVDEDSKASVIQNKPKATSLAERTDASNSVEKIRKLLAITQTKNHRKKLRRKLKKLLSKSMHNGSESTMLRSQFTEIVSKKEINVETSTQLSDQVVPNKSKKKKKKNISKTSFVIKEDLRNETEKKEQNNLSSSSENSNQNQEENISKKMRKKKRKMDGEKSVLSVDVNSKEEQISCKVLGERRKIAFLSDRHSQIQSEMGIKSKRKMDGKKCISLDGNSIEGQILRKDQEENDKTQFLSDRHSHQIHSETGRKLKKKKRKHEVTDTVFDAKFEKRKEKSDECLPQTQEKEVFKHRIEIHASISKSDLLGEINHKKLKRKETVCDDVNDLSPGKLKKHEASSSKLTSELQTNTGFSADLKDKPSEDETVKQQSYKRKRTKKRSKQKNIKKDHRPDHMKPPHLRANASEAII